MKKMKKIYPLLLFLCFDIYFCQAQDSEGDDDNRVEVVKMAYITKELNLTPQEAQNFWPVYNNYVSELKKARSQYPNDLDFEKKVVEIKERYQGNFKKVLGNNQQRANQVYTKDREFNNTLRNELNNRRQNRANNGQQPQVKTAPKNIRPNNNNNNIKRGNGNGNRKQRP